MVQKPGGDKTKGSAGGKNSKNNAGGNADGMFPRAAGGSDKCCVLADCDVLRQILDEEPAHLDMRAMSFQQLCMSTTNDKHANYSAGKGDRVRSLHDIFSKVCQNSAAIKKGLEDIPDKEFSHRSRPRPSGYASQTVLHFGGLCVPTLLDSCATCSVIPEEVLCVLLDYIFKGLKDGTFKPTDPTYPLIALEK